jgi:hypothetical protein
MTFIEGLLKSLKTNKVKVTGLLHVAPTRNFNLSMMVTDSEKSPFVGSSKVIPTKVNCILATPRKDTPDQIMLLLDEGSIVYSDVRFLSDKDFFKPIMVIPRDKLEEQIVAWWIHDFQERYGKH